MVRREFEKKRFTSKEDEWGTPIREFREWDREFNFNYDPCADPKRLLKPGIEYDTKESNGLNADWTGKRVFVNPPYGDIKTWVKKCYGERNRADLIVLLIFSRTDTKYFHNYIYHVADLRFVKGRLKFTNLNKPEFKQQTPTFPSMLCIFRNNGHAIDQQALACSI